VEGADAVQSRSELSVALVGAASGGCLPEPAGIPIQASRVYTRAEVASSLGRNLNGATVTVPLIPPNGAGYEDRLSQLDLRFAKNFRFGRARLQGQFDLYNAFTRTRSLPSRRLTVRRG